MTLRAEAFRFDSFIWEGVGIFKRTGKVSNGEPVYSPTEFGIKFIDAHKEDLQEEFDEAIKCLKARQLISI